VCALSILLIYILALRRPKCLMRHIVKLQSWMLRHIRRVILGGSCKMRFGPNQECCSSTLHPPCPHGWEQCCNGHKQHYLVWSRVGANFDTYGQPMSPGVVGKWCISPKSLMMHHMFSLCMRWISKQDIKPLFRRLCMCI
jgi:hypothetical protein